ncbi:MAG: hypothetical protein NWE98_05485 [Candidatus Bathyarchaeota archaeon]|nr:hypothetical protein [Candidatus Bathyarchaeota archaeon]
MCNDDKIYIIKDSIGDDVYASIVGEGKLHIYDTTTNTWSTGATLPTFYKLCRVVAITGEHAPKQIYVVGGMIIRGFTNYQGVNASFRYDPTTDSWSKAYDMPTARYEAAVAVVEDKIYAIGGATKLPGGWVATLTDAVEVYTPFDYGAVQSSMAPSKSSDSQPIFPEATAAVIGTVVAGTIIAATIMLVYHRKRLKLKTANQANIET